MPTLTIQVRDTSGFVLQTLDLAAVNTTEPNFAFGDASPASLGTVPANKIVESVELFITEAFDGSGATLTVGDVADPDGLMNAGQNNPAEVGAYSVAPGLTYGVDTEIFLTINPGSGATTGSGTVIVTYQH